jgi:glycine betaine/proline transport system ATP-binding protein
MEENKRVKIKVNGVTKIFGKNVKQALKQLENGKSKTDILQSTGCTVGVNQASFDVHSGEIFVIMGLSGSRTLAGNEEYINNLTIDLSREVN